MLVHENYRLSTIKYFLIKQLKTGILATLIQPFYHSICSYLYYKLSLHINFAPVFNNHRYYHENVPGSKVQ